MSITSAIVLFAMIWFVALLVALPIGLTTQEEAGDVTPGDGEASKNTPNFQRFDSRPRRPPGTRRGPG